MKRVVALLFLVIFVAFFFKPFFLKQLLPIPSDTIVGLYNPFRDLFAKEYPRGIPFKNFLITDPVRQQYPWRFLGVEHLGKGTFPLWNPYTAAGTPLFANQQAGLLYPINLLFVFLPFSFAWSLEVFLSPLLSAFFLYAYLRTLKLSLTASLFGAISYAFSGFSIAWMEWNTITHVALWLPLILLGSEKLFISDTKRSKFLWSVLIVLSLSASFFAGHLQTFVYLLSLCSAYFICKVALLKEKKRMFVALGIAMLLVVSMITVIQWFPLFQLILLSARDVDQVNWQQAGWFIPWQNLIQFVAPDFFGNPATLNYWGIWNYAEFVGYIGITPLVMGFLGIAQIKRKLVLFYTGVLLLSLVCALPTWFGQLPYLLHIPFLSTAQPTRILFLTDFSLAVLAGIGFDYFAKNQTKKVFISLSIVGVVFVGLWIFNITFAKRFLTPYIIVTIKRNLVLPTVLLSITGALVVSIVMLGKRAPFVGKMLLFSLLCLSAFDLFRFADKFTPFTSSSYLFPQDALLSYLQKQSGVERIMTTDSQILPPNFSIRYHLQSVDIYDPLYLKRYGEFMAALGRNKPNIEPPFGFNRIITPHVYDSRLIDLLGVRYILSLSDSNNSKLTKVFQEGDTRVYKNSEAYPRVFFVSKVVSVSSKREDIQTLFDPSVSLRDTAVVEELFTKQIGKGKATITSYTDNAVTVHTENTQDGFLVLTDVFYPTWHVEIDGRKTHIYLTDYTLRGIFVPKGNHTIAFFDQLF